ncbi:hypothetical protein DRE_06540 [Drechslerella stenobrocha 248]|uniref:4a-hydroxytetrahydrobiopterin dehydratase n=1 Tax=Drechslerella stenobrocha 248 TaxID=1043628 RepID=W7HXB9_9PEZI|nr:hypothetical protein DRE_06540 [Drechslerella stenobrocha 248]
MQTFRYYARRLPGAVANAAPASTAAASRSPAVPAAAVNPRSRPSVAAATSATTFHNLTTRRGYATDPKFNEFEYEDDPSDAGGTFVYRPPRDKPHFDGTGGGNTSEQSSRNVPWNAGMISKREVMSPEEARKVYQEFKSHKAVITPGPTDPPGYEPREVNILWRRTSPPERLATSISRLCYNPCYRVAKVPGPDCVNSADLVTVELGYASPALPLEPRPMHRLWKEWKISEGGAAIEKIFRFPNRAMALKFVGGLQYIMKIKISKRECLEHFPSIGIEGRRAFIRWGTHDPEPGISSFDIYCAKQTDRWAGTCGVKDALPEVTKWTFKVDVQKDTKTATKRPVEPILSDTDLSSEVPKPLSTRLLPAIQALVQAKNSLQASGTTANSSVDTLEQVKKNVLQTAQDLIRTADELEQASLDILQGKSSINLAADMSEMELEDEKAFEEAAREETAEAGAAVDGEAAVKDLGEEKSQQ